MCHLNEVGNWAVSVDAVFKCNIYILFLKIQHHYTSTAEDMQGKTEEEIEMMKTMGFGSFDTSKVRVQGCPVFCSHKEVQCIS